MNSPQESRPGPSRRAVVAAAGATGLAAAVTACGGSGTGNADAPADATGPLARVTDIPVGGGLILADRQVVVTQPEEGVFKAFSSICTHRQCTVGSVGDGTINCPCHGSRFSVEDGSVQHPPATEALPARKIKVSGDSVELV